MKKILFAALLLFSCQLSPFSTEVGAQNAKMPQNITLKDLSGQSVLSSVIQNDGKPIIISFWATWC